MEVAVSRESLRKLRIRSDLEKRMFSHALNQGGRPSWVQESVREDMSDKKVGGGEKGGSFAPVCLHVLGGIDIEKKGGDFTPLSVPFRQRAQGGGGKKGNEVCSGRRLKKKKTLFQKWN